MKQTDRKEILFYYESKDGANPNGDPGFDNQPRQLPDQTILVTDVRLKRTIRDYAKKQGKINFVDYNKDDKVVIAIDRVGELVGEKFNSRNRVDPNKDYIKELMDKTFDTNLFGAFVPVDDETRAKKVANTLPDGGPPWYKITGPVQFALGRSVNEVEIWHPQISAHFKGDKTTSTATLGRFWGVEYALIKFGGGINPSTIEKYFGKSFQDAEELLSDYLWDSTNELHSRSKYPQRSIFYLEVTYDGTIYNDLGNLIEDKMIGKHKKLADDPFGTDELIKKLNSRKEITEIRIRGCPELDTFCKELSIKLLKAKCI